MRCLFLILSTLTLSAAGILPSAAQAQPTLTLQQKIALANRFRPFIMTTKSGIPLLGLGSQEVFRPARWQWFVERATLVQGYDERACIDVFGHSFGSADAWPQGSPVTNPATGAAVTTADLADGSILLKIPHGDIRGIDSLIVDPSYALHVNDAPQGTENFRHGESWSDVLASGDGFYAHVESIPPPAGSQHQFINIEYTIFWAYNSSFCDFHNGDIATMIVVYDVNTDMIARLIYSVHGYAIEQFNLAHGKQYNFYLLRSENLNGAIQNMAAMSITIAKDRQYQQGGSAHSPGDPVIFLAEDPETGRFEHPVAMAENGGHELWPNTTGSITAAAAHWGDGLSFLTPKATFDSASNLQSGMQMLQMDTAADPNAPFLYFNGFFGTDPVTPLRHRTWFWPNGRGNSPGPQNPFASLPDSKFSDPDPYVTVTAGGATFDWPPDADYVNSGLQVFVASGLTPVKMTSQPAGRSGVEKVLDAKERAPTAELGDPAHPFGAVLQALSVAPCGGSLVLQPGVYSVPHALERECPSGTEGPITLVAPNGPALLTN